MNLQRRRAHRGEDTLLVAQRTHGDNYTACDLVTDLLHHLHREGATVDQCAMLLRSAEGHFRCELDTTNRRRD